MDGCGVLHTASGVRRAEDADGGRMAARGVEQTAFGAGMADRLAAHGMTVRQDVGAAEHQERLLRPLGRTMAVFDGERIVVADVPGISTAPPPGPRS